MALVVFDVDHTIVDGQSQRLLITYLFRRGMFPFFRYLGLFFWFFLYRFGLAASPENAFRQALGCFKGKSPADFTPILQRFVVEVIAPRMYADALRKVEEHQARGDYVMLISNAVTPLVSAIATYLGITHYRGTDIQIENGRYTGALAGKALYGEEKKKVLLNFLSEHTAMASADIWVYADHISDFDLLRVAHHPVVVNPGKKLKRIAEEFHWQVVIFQRV